MPTKKEIIKYVLKTPHNINPNVLSDMLDNITEEPVDGLMSVTVTPDITLSDETSLNEKLAELMPIAIGEQQTLNVHAELVADTEYTITITPNSDLYAFGDTLAQQKGEPLTINVTVENLELEFGVGAAETDNMEDQDTTAYIAVSITKDKEAV